MIDYIQKYEGNEVSGIYSGKNSGVLSDDTGPSSMSRHMSRKAEPLRVGAKPQGRSSNLWVVLIIESIM